MTRWEVIDEEDIWKVLNQEFMDLDHGDYGAGIRDWLLLEDYMHAMLEERTKAMLFDWMQGFEHRGQS